MDGMGRMAHGSREVTGGCQERKALTPEDFLHVFPELAGFRDLESTTTDTQGVGAPARIHRLLEPSKVPGLRAELGKIGLSRLPPTYIGTGVYGGDPKNN